MQAESASATVHSIRRSAGRKPTPQQQAIIEAVAYGGDPAVIGIAGAGCGKTATAKMVAEALQPGIDARYTAFGRDVVEAARASLPKNVKAQTMHSIAWRFAKQSGVGAIEFGWKVPDTRRALADKIDCGLKDFSHESLIRATLRNFCQSAADTVNSCHVPMDKLRHAIVVSRRKLSIGSLDDIDQRAIELRPFIVADAMKLWDRANNPHHWLPVTQEISLKRFALSRFGIACDLLMFDESQDVSPVMLQIVMDSIAKGTRVFAVGDPAQSIFGFTGAIDAVPALCAIPGAKRLPLTNSWRFGSEIAAMANGVLHYIDGEPLTGVGPCRTQFDHGDQYTVLSRSNAALIERACDLIDSGQDVAMAEGLIESARKDISAAYDLQAEDFSNHPELIGLTWDDAKEYAELLTDNMQRALQLVEKWGDKTPDKLDAIASTAGTRPDEADVFLSTVHKAKGGEWDQCLILGGFRLIEFRDGHPPCVRPDEARLAYVAVTRAKTAIAVEDEWLSAIADRRLEEKLQWKGI